MTEISIAGMKFDEGQIKALRSYFKEEWQREEIYAAISDIIDILSIRNRDNPDDEIDQQISLRLLDKAVENDIVERFHHRVPEWNKEALQEANEHDVGVWRSLYDIIVPEMRAKLRTGDAKARTYPVNGKIYTEPEVTAICDMWKGIQDHKAVSDSVNAALARIADPDAAEWAHKNDPYIMAQCMAALSAWHDQQHRCLVLNNLTLHYLVYDKLKTMYEEHKKEREQK